MTDTSMVNFNQDLNHYVFLFLNKKVINKQTKNSKIDENETFSFVFFSKKRKNSKDSGDGQTI